MRDAYLAKAEAQFGEIQATLALLGARAQSSTASARIGAEEALLAAQSKHDDALHKLETLKRTGVERWESVKTTFETAWTDLCSVLGRRNP